MPGPWPKYPIQLTLEQEAHLQHLSTCYTAPYAEVQRARMLLLAHQQPTWRNAEIARQVGCCVHTVKRWRQRWQQTDSVRDAPRAGTRRTFTPLQRADIALACSSPRVHGKPWPRWSGSKMPPACGTSAMHVSRPVRTGSQRATESCLRCAHQASASSSVLASWRSAVSKPSVNQP